MKPKRIGKGEVRRALAKYGIGFDFPCDAKTGKTVTCWSDLHSRNGDTAKLKLAILAEKNCEFTVSNIPSIMLASFNLIRV